LSWSSSNATQLKLYPGPDNLPTQGSQTVSPNDSTVYTLTAVGPGGQAIASTTIAVSTPPPPAAAAALTPEQMFRQMVQDAFFDYDKSDLRADAKEALSRDADFLRAHPEIRFKIEGHCDERGGEEYNLALGDRRADSTRTYLVTLGIATDRIQTVSLGKEQPFCTAENEACYQQNRRGHFAMAQ
jgi:peptidoglycan-associated lipoprotein